MGEPTDANSAPCALGCCLAVTAAAKDAVGAFFPERGASTKEARLERGGEVLAADAPSVTAAVCDLLGLDLEA